MFLSDAMESFSTTSCPSEVGEGSGETSIPRDEHENTRINTSDLRSPGNSKPRPIPGASPSLSSSMSGKRRTSSFTSTASEGATGECGDDHFSRRGNERGERDRRASAPEESSPCVGIVRCEVGGGGGGGVNEARGMPSPSVDLKVQVGCNTDGDGDSGEDSGIVDSQQQTSARVPPIATYSGFYNGAVNAEGDISLAEGTGREEQENSSPSPHGLNHASPSIDTDRLGNAESFARSPSAVIR